MRVNWYPNILSSRGIQCALPRYKQSALFYACPFSQIARNFTSRNNIINCSGDQHRRYLLLLYELWFEKEHSSDSIIGRVVATVRCFVGLEQSKLIGGVLSGRITLSSKEDMMVEIETLYATLEAKRIPKRYTHHLGITTEASQYRCSGTEEWRLEMFLTTIMRNKEHPESYRDEWEDHHLLSQAYQDFSFYL